MQTASSKDIRAALKDASRQDCQDLLLRLARFKKENKELLTYLLFEQDAEDRYIRSICEDVIDTGFEGLNRKNYYWIRKGVRKTLKSAKKYIRYSGRKETEIEILLHFLDRLSSLKPGFRRNQALLNIFERQSLLVRKRIEAVHPDLQYDYQLILQEITHQT
ncbi:MAG: hypothetical protein KTR24_03510 [Saprospiraceae bacterium]|nr:hypothetical protein [Saprospiraceae bacterium]